jgi:CRISPR/Cas system-associated exonuclease Cas4 (RecB family)
VEELFTGEPTDRNSAVFQTFLYAWILGEKASYQQLQPALFFVRDIYNQNFDYRIYRSENRQRKVVESFEEFKQEFVGRMASLISDIFDKDVPFSQTEDVKYCEYCPYNRICMRK